MIGSTGLLIYGQLVPYDSNRSLTYTYTVHACGIRRIKSVETYMYILFVLVLQLILFGLRPPSPWTGVVW